MANHNQNGGRDAAPPDDNRASWRPQDQAPQPSSHRQRGHDDDHDDRSWRDRSYDRGGRDDDRRTGERDPRRWEGSRGSELGYHEDRDVGWRTSERYGQGQSGYSAGRHGDDRSQRIQNRSELAPSSGFDDRHHDLGLDDRFTGRGRSGYWLDRNGVEPEHHARGHDTRNDTRSSYAGRDIEAERNASRTGSRQGYDERTGYQAGSSHGQPMGYSSGSYGQGYGGYGARHQATQDEVHRSPGSGSPTQRGTGPHRGRGPTGYQRSDERLREMVCESLTEDDLVDASQIEVTVNNGEVTLSGVVEDRRSKRHAEDCVYSISGVRDVQNLLRVRDDDRPTRSSPYGHDTDVEMHYDKKHRA